MSSKKSFAIGFAVGVIVVLGVLFSPFAYPLGLKRVEVVTYPITLRSTVTVPATTVTETRTIVAGAGEVVTITKPVTVRETVTTTAMPRMLTTTISGKTLTLWANDGYGFFPVATVTLPDRTLYVLVKTVTTTRSVALGTVTLAPPSRHSVLVVRDPRRFGDIYRALIANASEYTVFIGLNPPLMELSHAKKKIWLLSQWAWDAFLNGYAAGLYGRPEAKKDLCPQFAGQVRALVDRIMKLWRMGFEIDVDDPFNLIVKDGHVALIADGWIAVWYGTYGIVGRAEDVIDTGLLHKLLYEWGLPKPSVTIDNILMAAKDLCPEEFEK